MKRKRLYLSQQQQTTKTLTMKICKNNLEGKKFSVYMELTRYEMDTLQKALYQHTIKTRGRGKGYELELDIAQKIFSKIM